MKASELLKQKKTQKDASASVSASLQGINRQLDFKSREISKTIKDTILNKECILPDIAVTLYGIDSETPNITLVQSNLTLMISKNTVEITCTNISLSLINYLCDIVRKKLIYEGLIKD